MSRPGPRAFHPAPNTVDCMTVTTWAREIAARHLAEPLPRRWAHTQGVARRAQSLRPILGRDADLLEAAAWLHDVGYAPDITVTGFHPLDGARYLRDTHSADDMLCRLVAHHSCARVEARGRGLADQLNREFLRPAASLDRALIYCDMTTGPDGTQMSVDERLADIFERYGAGHVVHQSIRRAAPTLTTAVTDVTYRLAGVSVEMGDSGPVEIVPQA